MTKLEELLAQVTAKNREIDELVAAYNEAFRAKNLDEMDAKVELLKLAEKSYAGLSRDYHLESHRTESMAQTITNVLTHFEYVTIGHTDDQIDNVKIGIKTVQRNKTIDLAYAFAYYRYDCGWTNTVAKLNLLLTLRAAESLDISKKKLKQINDTFAMKKIARSIDLGETPTSNTQVTKLLQRVFDEILFVAQESDPTKNTYHAMARDVAFLDMCYTKHGRELCEVSCASNKNLEKLIAEIMHKIIVKKAYNVLYKEQKQK